MKYLCLLACLLLAACVQTSVSRPGQAVKYGPLKPGGPVFKPMEFLVSEPSPGDPPFGKYFANDQPRVPAGLTDPYWINGYWGWKEPYWDWVPGRWVERPRPGLMWINARYYRTGGQQFWVTGYWE